MSNVAERNAPITAMIAMKAKWSAGFSRLKPRKHSAMAIWIGMNQLRRRPIFPKNGAGVRCSAGDHRNLNE